MEPPTQCFLSYSHWDYEGFQRLRVHVLANLRPFGVRLWHDDRLYGGTGWNEAIELQIERSQIFVLMLTNDFLVSDYIGREELPRIVARHRANSALVLPVIYRTCSWKFYFGSYVQALPKRAGRPLPIFDWRDREKGFAETGGQIADAIADWFAIEPTSPVPLAAGRNPA